jgi:hypothetical protein
LKNYKRNIAWLKWRSKHISLQSDLSPATNATAGPTLNAWTASGPTATGQPSTRQSSSRNARPTGQWPTTRARRRASQTQLCNQSSGNVPPSATSIACKKVHFPIWGCFRPPQRPPATATDLAATAPTLWDLSRVFTFSFTLHSSFLLRKKIFENLKSNV